MVGRDQPPDVQDGPYGWNPDSVSNFEAPSDGRPDVLGKENAFKLARDAYESSTNWLNSGRRARWNDSLRSFQSLHPSGSKYLSRDYAYRSTLFRPKSRAMVRKAEAQTASAFFSNEDVVSIQAQNDDDPYQLASASIMQQLLQYRLTKNIPWFLTVTGARQDCEVMGICIAKPYWKYEEKTIGSVDAPMLDPSGQPMFGPGGEPLTERQDVVRKVHDEPVIDLLAPENFRFEPGADWRDPVGTSPYLIEMIPMYVDEVLEKVRSGEWLPIAESAILASTDMADDVTRRTREAGRVPGKDADAWKPRSYDIAWVRANTMRWRGQDWYYYTLGSAGEMLTEPRPLKEVFLHGVRPYVVGHVMLETHKTYPSSKIEIVRDLQRAANDDWNLRFDNLKLVLNPRQFVKVGDATDLNDVRMMMPGKTVLVKSPGGADPSVVWDRPPDVTQAAYEEQDRINLDFDELVGDFSNSSVQSSEIQQQSATGMNLMSGQASGMNEYELRMFAETFVEKVLQHLVQLEQAYETDPVILAIAGNKAKLFQKYGIDQITDELLNQELTTRVNVGIGATNPDTKLKRFVMAGDIIAKIFGPAAAQGANFEEIVKEVFGMAGYKDGSRFFKPGFDPAQAMAQMAQAKQVPQKQPPPPDPTRLQAAQIQAQSRIQERQIEADNDQKLAQMDMQKTMYSEEQENWRTRFNAQREIETMAQQNHHQAMAALGQVMPRA